MATTLRKLSTVSRVDSQPMRPTQRLTLLGIAVAAACGKAAAPGKPDTANMRAMKAGADASAKTGAGAPVNQIDLTAAQIEHGGVRWGPVTMGDATTRAAMPGTVIPNENRTA